LPSRSNSSTVIVVEDAPPEGLSDGGEWVHVRAVATDGGVETVGVDADDIPEECTTRLCDGDPEWAVRFEDGVSRRTEAPPEDPDPPVDSVCPFVCEECKRGRYDLVDDDRWVRVAALVTDGGVDG
jgi:hypothetical protein